jgi:hypothetical protein
LFAVDQGAKIVLMSDEKPIPEWIGSLRPEVAKQLAMVQPSFHNGTRLYPCEVVTDDGTVHPRVYVMEARSLLKYWGGWPWEQGFGNLLRAETIRSLRSSPARLHAELASRLYDAGESGMAYYAFGAELLDGSRLHYVTAGTGDFPCWGPDVEPTDAVEVLPHERNPEWETRSPNEHESGSDYMWAPFR